MTEMEMYLKKVSTGLYRLPESERDEILGEIRNHIYEAVSRQEPVGDVIAKLGSPLKLAQSYVSIHNINHNEISFGSILGSMAFFVSAGLSGLVIIPTLFILAAAFFFSAIITVGYSIVDLFIDLPGGIGYIRLDHAYGVYESVIFTGFPAVLVALGVSLIFSGLAYGCWKLLKKYLSFVSLRYQKLRIAR